MYKQTINFFKLILGSALAFSFMISPASANNFTMGNYDLEGTRSIQGNQSILKRSDVLERGLEVKFHSRYVDDNPLVPDAPVATPPVIRNGKVYYGSYSISVATFAESGAISAMDANTGETLWSKEITNGVSASPLIDGNNLYVAGNDGTLYWLNAKNGDEIDSAKPNLSAFGLDSAATGPIKIDNGDQDLIILSLNPGDESWSAAPPEFRPFFLGGSGGLVAYKNKGKKLEEVWRVKLTDYDDGVLVGNPHQDGGAGIWELTPSYSSRHNLIYVTTGQTAITEDEDGDYNASDSFFAIDATNGEVVWQFQTRINDMWSFFEFFPPAAPIDTDVGDGAAVFKIDGKEYVAAGSKRGYFYVLDSETGELVNGVDADNNGEPDRDFQGIVKSQVDMFAGTGGLAVGNAVDGGINLESGVIQISGEGGGEDAIHFSTLLDYSESIEAFAQGACLYSLAAELAGIPQFGCPSLADTSYLVITKGDGSEEIGRWGIDDAALFTPLHLDGLIYVISVSNATSEDAQGNPVNPVSTLNVLDVAHITPNCTTNCDPILVEQVPLISPDFTKFAISFGSPLSIGNGMVYAGNGYFGDFAELFQGLTPESNGIFGIGLKDPE